MGLWKKAAAVIATATLLFGLVGTAFAATPDNITAGATRMHELGLVNGKNSANPDDLQLGDSITRAELMTILVRAFGYKDAAEVLKGANAFPDTATHWASGYIQVAKNIIVEKNKYEMGMPDGTFAPDGKVTAAQAVAFLMKFIGVAPGTEAWPNNYLNAAVTAGLLSAADRDSIAANANQEATRGLVFYLADQSFYSYPLADGKTVYTKYVKPQGPSLTVESIDATTDALTVAITGKVGSDATEVFVGSSANKVTVGAGGTFTYTYTLALGPNDITVTAKDIAGNSTTKTVSTTRATGAAATIAASLSSQMVKAGGTANLTVTIKDKNGTELSGLAPVVTVTGNIGTYADGVFTAATTSGATGKLTVSYEQATPVDIEVAVVAGDLDHLVITPATPSVGIGTPVAFAAKGVDAYGNDVPLTDIAWTKTGGIIDTTGTFVGTTAGTYTVTASAGGKTGTATATVYGAPAAIRLSAVSDFVANAKSTRTVSATVVDAAGNVATGYNGKVNFVSSNTTIAKLASASVDAVAGRAEVKLTSGGTTKGTAVISAAATGLTGATVNAKALDQVLTSIGAELDTTSIYADGSSQATATYTEYDQEGVAMAAAKTVSVSLKLTVSPENTIVKASTTTPTVKDAFDVTLTSAGRAQGAATISAVVTTTGYTAIPVASVTVSTTPVGVPATVAIDAIDTATATSTGAKNTTQTIKVRILDAAGNQVTTSGLNDNVKVFLTNKDVTIDDDGTYTGDSTTGWTPKNGAIVFNATATTADTYTYKATATWKPGSTVDLTSATASGTFVHGPANKISLTGSPKPGTDVLLSADGVATGTLTAKVTDSADNAITDEAVTFVFTQANGTPNAVVDFTGSGNTQSVDAVDGAATVTVTALKANGASDTVKACAKLNGATTETCSSNLTVSTHIMGVVAKATTTLPGSMKAGVEGNVKVAVTDSADTAVTTDQGRSVTVTAYDSKDNELGTFSGSTVNGIATIPVTITKKDTVTFKTKVDGVSATIADKSVAVAPADAAKIVISSDLTSIPADGSSTADITVTLQDEFGNEAVAAAATTVTLTLDSTTYGAFAGGKTADVVIAKDAGHTLTTDMITVTTKVGTVGITGKVADDSLTEGALSISTISGGFLPVSFQVSSISDTTANGTSVQKVTVTLVDGSGIRVTGDDRDVTLTIKDTTTAKVNSTDHQTLTTDKGVVTFNVIDTKAETAKYEVTGTSFDKVTVTGTFVPATASKLVISLPADMQHIIADGSSTATYTVEVQDANNNVVSVNGSVKIKIESGADYADLLTTDVAIAGGVGSFQVQSKWRELLDGNVVVSATTTDILDKDGNALAKSDNNSDLYVDVAVPTVTGATVSDSTIVVTFSEAMRADEVTNKANYTLTGLTFAATAITYDAATHKATYTFTGAPAAGNKVAIAASALQDLAGRYLATYTYTVPTP